MVVFLAKYILYSKQNNEWRPISGECNPAHILLLITFTVCKDVIVSSEDNNNKPREIVT